MSGENLCEEVGVQEKIKELQKKRTELVKRLTEVDGQLRELRKKI